MWYGGRTDIGTFVQRNCFTVHASVGLTQAHPNYCTSVRAVQGNIWFQAGSTDGRANAKAEN